MCKHMHIPYCHFRLRKFFYITNNKQSYNPKSTRFAKNRNKSRVIQNKTKKF